MPEIKFITPFLISPKFVSLYHFKKAARTQSKLTSDTFLKIQIDIHSNHKNNVNE